MKIYHKIIFDISKVSDIIFTNIRKAMKDRVIYVKPPERRTLGGSSLCRA